MDNTQNEKLSIEQYLLLETEDKLTYLFDQWGFEKNLFYGRVQEKKEIKDQFTFINDSYNDIGKQAFNPFIQKKIHSVFCNLNAIPNERGIRERRFCYI